MSKFIFLFSLTFFLALQPQPTVQTGLLLAGATTKALITMACSSSTAPPLCYNVLNCVATNPFLNPCDLTVVAVQAATKTAMATFDFINTTLTVKAQEIQDPEMKNSLMICANQYKTVLDYLEKTNAALTHKVDCPKIPDYLTSACAAVAKCDASCVHLNQAMQIATKNTDCSKLLKNALNIYQVFSEYILDPNHPGAKVSISASASASVGAVPQPVDVHKQPPHGVNTNMKLSMPFFSSSAPSPSSSHDDKAPSPSIIPSSNGMRLPFQSMGMGSAPSPKQSNSDAKSPSSSPSPSSGGMKSYLPSFKFP